MSDRALPRASDRDPVIVWCVVGALFLGVFVVAGVVLACIALSNLGLACG